MKEKRRSNSNIFIETKMREPIIIHPTEKIIFHDANGDPEEIITGADLLQLYRYYKNLDEKMSQIMTSLQYINQSLSEK